MLKKIGLSLVFAPILLSCSKAPTPPAPVKPVRPAKIILAQAASENYLRVFPGTVESAMQSDLAFRVGGQLEQLPALPGKAFKKGQLLAKIDDSQYKNERDDKQARYHLAKSQHDKMIQLMAQNFVSPTEVEESEAHLKAMQAALATAEDNLKHTRLTAPFDGVVANLNTENHQVINPHETMLTFRSNSHLDVRFSVPENLLGKLNRVENPNELCVEVRFNAFPQKSYPACFKEYESIPDRLTRTYSVVHRLPLIQEFNALPKMAVEVTLDVSSLLREKLTQGVLVPLSAVFEEGGKSYVWQVDSEGNVAKQAIEVSGILEDKMHVSAGLEANQAIVALGVSYIHEGMRVRPIAKERGL